MSVEPLHLRQKKVRSALDGFDSAVPFNLWWLRWGLVANAWCGALNEQYDDGWVQIPMAEPIRYDSAAVFHAVGCVIPAWLRRRQLPASPTGTSCVNATVC